MAGDPHMQQLTRDNRKTKYVGGGGVDVDVLKGVGWGGLMCTIRSSILLSNILLEPDQMQLTCNMHSKQTRETSSSRMAIK